MMIPLYQNYFNQKQAHKIVSLEAPIVSSLVVQLVEKQLMKDLPCRPLPSKILVPDPHFIKALPHWGSGTEFLFPYFKYC
jgi:hypothetical protein